MGDMADYALDCGWNDFEHFTKYEHASDSVRYEEGLIDEYGNTYGNPGSLPIGPGIDGFRRRKLRASGPGACPICGSNTVLKKGVHGEFYGCECFPFCKGSRDL